MTLVIALRCRGGAILACDSKVTRREPGGRVTGADRHTKLMLHRGVVWGWAGSPDAAQRFAVFATEDPDISAAAPRTALQEAVEGCTRQMLDRIDGEVDFQLLLCAWNRQDDKALILRVHVAGGAVRSVWVDDLDNVRMIGSREAQALAQHALRSVGFADFQNVPLAAATTLAHKLIADVAAIVDDVGEPVHLGSVTEHTALRLDPADVEGARDSAGRFTRAVRSLLTTEGVPADSLTTDRGVDPPRT